MWLHHTVSEISWSKTWSDRCVKSIGWLLYHICKDERIAGDIWGGETEIAWVAWCDKLKIITK